MTRKDINRTSTGRSKTKVLVVDDHSVVVEGIARALEKELDFDIIGSAKDGLEAIQKVKSLKPHLVIMDISLPHLNGIETIQEIAKWDSKVTFVVFSMYHEKEFVVSLFKMGISGYVVKDEPITELVLALKAVKEGGTFYSKAVQKALQDYLKELPGPVTSAHKVIYFSAYPLAMLVNQCLPVLLLML